MKWDLHRYNKVITSQSQPQHTIKVISHRLQMGQINRRSKGQTVWLSDPLLVARDNVIS